MIAEILNTTDPAVPGKTASDVAFLIRYAAITTKIQIVAGIVLGCAFAIVLLLKLWFWISEKKKQKRK